MTMTIVDAPLVSNNLPLWFLDKLLEEDYCYINYLAQHNRDNAYYFIQSYDNGIRGWESVVYLLLQTADGRYEVHSEFNEANEFKNYDSSLSMVEAEMLRYGDLGRLFN